MILIPVMFTAAVLLLLTVTFMGLLEVPTFCFPKATLGGAS